MGLSGGLSTNGGGAFSTVLDRGGVLMPMAAGGYPSPTTPAAIGTQFKAFFSRAIVPQSGTLHDISVYNGSTVAGNTNVAVFDCGEASAAHYTPWWSSGSVAASGAGAWQIIGDPALPVYAGQHVMLAVMNDGTTNTFGTKAGPTTAASDQLPTNFLPAQGGNLPKLLATVTFGSLTYGAVTEASLVTATSCFLVIGRIA